MELVDELFFRAAFILLWSVFIVSMTWVRIRARDTSDKQAVSEAIRSEGLLRTVAMAIFAPLWFGGIILYILQPSLIDLLTMPLPDLLRAAMVGVSTLSIAFTIWGYVSLGTNWVHALEPSTFRSRADDTLVTWGAYRVVRNPIYLGAFAYIASLALVAANWLILLPVIPIMAIIYGQVDGEEVMLVERFGEEYREYMRNTPRFIPRLRRRAKS